MSPIETMITASPNPAVLSGTKSLADCIDCCAACVLTCTSCADACLGEAGIRELRLCMRLDLDCADVCAATARVLSRSFEPDRELVRMQLAACEHACRACGAECARHASRHEHCAICSEACRRCETACMELLRALEAELA